MVKFTKELNQYSYILSFDLAKFKTGWSLIDIAHNYIVDYGIIDMNTCKDLELGDFWIKFEDMIEIVIKRCMEHVSKNKSMMLITKEKCPNQAGRFSTVETLQALAQAHAILDLVVAKNIKFNSSIDCYDYDGVHAASEKAFFKHLTGIDKPTKEDIANEIIATYGNYDLQNSLDITDSIAVTMTLINWKWNRDIDVEIKELKKQKKLYKTDKKISEISHKIEQLENYKIYIKEA